MKNITINNQKFTSANTSINKNKMPSSTKKINWNLYKNKTVLDIGGGKFDNLKDYLKAEYNITLHVYDKYNRSEEENKVSLTCNPDLVICNNVLNVIQEDIIIEDIVKLIESFGCPFYVSIYEGNRTGKGKQSKKDCYQRNEKLAQYKGFFTNNVATKKGMISNI